MRAVSMRISLHHIFVAVVVVLFGASLFFTVQVVAFKKSLAPGSAAPGLKSGQAAVVTNTIDGDEVIVKWGEESLRVRLLGIYSYDPTADDPLVKPMARQAFLHLDKTLRNREVEIVFDELKFDSRKRLLAYLQKDGADVGLEMIAGGLALAYTKYPFSRMNPYLLAQEKAMQDKAGLWADRQLALRSSQLKILWDTERTRGD
ncbi:MAG: hypothetical protein CVU61_09995 [Deltaproteobacteria bacterium HGW-Deltaproteobacteria-19]|nr:MAG: hypothetical protein CVU61_09995 [Deltaproteobacteria bacterium HGW-Deltaproteobacteria-19]